VNSSPAHRRCASNRILANLTSASCWSHVERLCLLPIEWILLQALRTDGTVTTEPFFASLSMDDQCPPFGPGDTTVGSETELQAVVTHLRMLWRRWKKKAANAVGGQPLTPTGYDFVDRLLSTVCRLKGDLVPDFRLIDYLSAPLSTDHSPALDGRLGNIDALKRDLAAQGEYDPRMAFYMLYRQRPFDDLGYSGFEGRYYSLCHSLRDDLAPAVDLQNLVTAPGVPLHAARRNHARRHSRRTHDRK
jgi:hypothetical protein